MLTGENSQKQSCGMFMTICVKIAIFMRGGNGENTHRYCSEQQALFPPLYTTCAKKISREPKAAPCRNWLSLWLHPSQGLVRLGGHELIQTGAAGEAVFKGHNIPGAANQPQPAATLVMYESWFSEMCRSPPVRPGRWRIGSRGLKIPSLQHEAGGVGTEELLHVLC